MQEICPNNHSGPCEAILNLQVVDKKWTDEQTETKTSQVDGIGPSTLLVEVLSQDQEAQIKKTCAQTCNKCSGNYQLVISLVSLSALLFGSYLVTKTFKR